MSETKKDKQMRELKAREEKEKILRDYLKGGHKKPTTRREFLASGLLGATASVLAPTIPSLISSSAWAQELQCNDDASGAGSMPIYVHLQLAGGAVLFANALPCGNNGQPFTTGEYARLGVGSIRPEAQFANNAQIWMPDTQNGSSGSPLFNRFREILGSADADIMQNTALVQVSAESVDDTAGNRQEISGMLELAGLAGSNLPYIQAARGNRFLPAIVPAANMLRANSAAAIESSIKFSGALGTFSGNVTQQSAIQGLLIRAIEDLNKYQVEQLARTPSSHASQKIFKNLIQCASKKNTAIQGSPVEIDIYSAANATDLATVWAQNEGAFNPTLVQAAQAIGACVRGYSGAAVITLGGYDYHLGNTRSRANAKDREAGSVIARILLSAKRKNRKMFLFVSTDGSASSPNDSGAGEDVNWIGDIPTRSMGYIFAYDPNGAPAFGGYNSSSYKDAPFQLNQFDNDLSVGNTNPIGSVDANELYAAAVFLNYLAFAGIKDVINKPELAAVKKKLEDSAPNGASIWDYYTRIKG